jgi:hypothetical protein
LNSKSKAAGIGMGLKILNALQESEMYSLGVMHGQQKMRKKMLEQLDHLISEIKNDY